MTYTTAHGHAGSLTHWTRPGIGPTSSWIPAGFLTAEPQGNSSFLFKIESPPVLSFCLLCSNVLSQNSYYFLRYMRFTSVSNLLLMSVFLPAPQTQALWGQRILSLFGALSRYLAERQTYRRSSLGVCWKTEWICTRELYLFIDEALQRKRVEMTFTVVAWISKTSPFEVQTR